MTVATISHIVIDDKGVARIAGSRSRVIDIVLDTQAYGLTPEQIHEEYPHLSLAQIYAALSYYHDHKAELDSEIQRRFQAAEYARMQAGEPPLVTRLRTEGKLSERFDAVYAAGASPRSRPGRPAVGRKTF